MLGEIITAALDKRDFGFDAMRESAEMTAVAEQNKFMQQISWLSLLAAIAPMLGLLGTVVGMIGAFMEMASSPTGSVGAADLSGTIGGAMVTTATGLIIAIPMMVFFFYLRAKVNKAVLDAGVFLVKCSITSVPVNKPLNHMDASTVCDVLRLCKRDDSGENSYGKTQVVNNLISRWI